MPLRTFVLETLQAGPWAKERMALKDTNTTAADLRLVGYIFMVVARRFVCGAQLCSGGLGTRRRRSTLPLNHQLKVPPVLYEQIVNDAQGPEIVLDVLHDIEGHNRVCDAAQDDGKHRPGLGSGRVALEV